MNEVKVVDLEEVIKALKFKSMAGQKVCYIDGTAVKYIDVADIRDAILDLQAKIKVMQESYDEVIAEQVKLSETATAQKIYDKAVEYYDEPTSLVVSYHQMMDWLKQNYGVGN